MKVDQTKNNKIIKKNLNGKNKSFISEKNDLTTEDKDEISNAFKDIVAVGDIYSDKISFTRSILISRGFNSFDLAFNSKELFEIYKNIVAITNKLSFEMYLVNKTNKCEKKLSRVEINENKALAYL